MKQTLCADVAALADVTALAFEARRPGCARSLLHEDEGMRAIVLRVQPGSGVPAHKHAGAHDLFLGIKGELEIRWDGGCWLLRAGGFCRVAPGVRHEVSNRSDVNEAFCVLLHTRPGQFDFVETE